MESENASFKRLTHFPKEMGAESEHASFKRQTHSPSEKIVAMKYVQ